MEVAVGCPAITRCPDCSRRRRGEQDRCTEVPIGCAAISIHNPLTQIYLLYSMKTLLRTEKRDRAESERKTI